ncbi:MAG: tetratricopeptide repeat protein [Candidatus Zixiibacteriota bacterium]|nr:MAG: tetratricopeptide repeat protein [candidate division Zixibacteria bacterium]
MKQCLDKRFEKLLHAYELGILSDEDRADFEIHQMECDYCFEQARQFKDPVYLIEHDPDVRASIKQMDEEKSSDAAGTRDAVPGTGRRRFPGRLTPLRAVFSVAAVLVILVLKPWNIEFKTDQEVVASDNRLAVMYLVDSTYEQEAEKLGNIVTNLLITDLSESRRVDVVSSQRLHDLLNLLDRERTETINLYVVQEVADKTRAKWMLTGSIYQTQSALVITTELVDVATRSTIATQRITGSASESVFTLVDRLSAKILNDLSLPDSAQLEIDGPVADITTHSLEAYRHYLEGVDNYYKLYWREAVQSFQSALQYDSTFAMAYYYLARIHDPEHIARAVQYSSKASQRQQYYIRSMQASVEGDVSKAVEELEQAVQDCPDEKDALQMLGLYMYTLQRYEEAIDYLTRVIEIDPLHKQAYNQLAYAYDQVGDLEKSIWAIGQYISIAPDEANPYDTRGEILANNGMIDQAIESYKKALEIKPDFQSSRMNLGLLCALNGDYVTAQSCFEELATVSDAGMRSTGRLYLAYIPLYRGQYEAALRILDEGIASDIEDPGNWATASKHGLRAVIYRERGDLLLALDELRKAADITRETWREYEFLARRLLVQILAELGDTDAAEQAAEELRRDLIEAEQNISAYWYAVGSIQFAAGNMAEAVISFEKALEESDRFPLPGYFMLGRAYLEADRLGEAVQQFERLHSEPADPRLYFGPSTVKSYYYLGLAYERSGWINDAIEQYERFVDIWKDADPVIEEMDDARARLAELKNRP